MSRDSKVKVCYPHKIQGALIPCSWGGRTLPPLWKAISLSYKSKPTCPYDPANMLLGIYPKEMKTYVDTETFPWILKEALFVIARAWEL